MWLTSGLPRGPQESLQCKANCCDQTLGVAMTSVDLLLELIWSEPHLQVLRTEHWKNLWCHLIHPFSFHFKSIHFCLSCFSLLSSKWVSDEDSDHYFVAQHISEHRACAVTSYRASLSCNNLPCAMWNNVTSVNPLSLWAKPNQFAVHLPWAEGVHGDCDHGLDEVCQLVKPW